MAFRNAKLSTTLFSSVTVILVLVECAISASSVEFPSYKEKWFNQTLDHFRFESPPRTWSHRYLYNDEHWTGKGRLPNGCKGPILFYTGNEGPIDAFWASNGFMIEVLAPKWGALLIFAEERYYGKSLPFGSESLSPDNAVFLSTEQVLADYALLVTHLKTSLGAEDCPVVAFGGSYGGTLTTYFRLKYPDLVVGGLAASAPIGYYANSQWASHNIDQYTWIDIVNKDYEDAHPECLKRLTQATSLIAKTGETTSGRTELASTFHLCNPLDAAQPLVDYFTDAIETIPQENYPYAIGTMPAWPVNASCDVILAADPNNPQELLKQASIITDFYYGYKSSGPCLSGKGQGGIPGGGPGPAEWGSWGYQSCTETLHQFSSRGIRSFQFNMANVIADCRKYFNTEPNTVFPEIHYGGYAIGDGKTTASNLIWSSGRLDPWHGGGFLTPNTSKTNTWIMLDLGAHHFDLRGPHPEDPKEVTIARALEEKIIKSWIDEYAKAS